jgi:hypothetical protein
MSLAHRLSCVTLPALVLALGGGCTQLDLTRPMPWPLGPKDSVGTPNKVVAMWADTVLYQPGSPPTRGFGGRLMFYGEDDGKPIKVDGSLVVYAFDEEGRAPNNVKPDRKYVFTREQVAKHYSKSDLGNSYSFWLPWNEVGGPQKEVSLIVRFFPADGDVLVGKQSRHLLPGRTDLACRQAAEPWQQARNQGPWGRGPVAGEQGSGVRQVSYDAPAGAWQPPGEGDGVGPAGYTQPGMTTTTIVVPPRFGRQVPVAAAGSRINRRRTGTAQAAGQSPAKGPSQAGYAQQAPTQQAATQQQALAGQQVFGQGPVLPGRAFAAQQAPGQQQADCLPATRQPPSGPTGRPTNGRDLWPQRLGGSPYHRGPGLQPPATPGAVWTVPAAGPTSQQYEQPGW